jgi:hypothetical protein
MTDEKLKQAQDIKRKIEGLEKELENFANATKDSPLTINLPNVGKLIEDVKQVFLKYLNEYNEKFRKL